MNQQITPLQNTPLNRLFLAINHYISTGDHVGEGMSIPHGPQKAKSGEPAPGDGLKIIIPVNRTNEIDLRDFTAFRSRFSELEKQFNTSLKNEGTNGDFQVWTFVIYYRQAEPLAVALAEKPGPAGWGSMKKTLDQNGIKF